MLTLEKPSTLINEGGPYKFTLAEFDKMNELRFFDDVRVELLDGEIFVIPKQDYRHAQSIRIFNKALFSAVGTKVFVSPQLPVVLLSPPPDYVEPDLALLKLPEEQYSAREVTSDDVLLAIEISNTTLVRDQGKKLAAYARNRIPQVWIHNLMTGKLEVYHDPDGAEYRFKQVLSQGQQVDVKDFEVRIDWW
jgi:Uma2 family endonuclease